MTNRWHEAGIIGFPKMTRKIGFTNKAMEFYRKYAKHCYITEGIKAGTIFVGYFNQENNMEKTFLIDQALSTFAVSNISSDGRTFGYLIHKLACKECKSQLILLEDMLTCMKCANIK